VGSDWAEAKHAVCLQTAGAAPRECCQLEPTPEAIDTWGTTLRTRVHGQPVAICLALTTGPLVSALRQDDLLGLFPLNPLTLARYRAAFTPRRATDDPTDAALQLARLRTHRDKLPPLNPPSPTLRALAQLGDHRRRVVGDHGRLTNRLTRALKHSFPPGLHWLQEKDTALCCDFLSRWPPLTAVPLARRAPRDPCFRAHHVRDAEGVAQRREAIQSAPPLTTAAGVIAPNTLLGQALVAQRHPDLPFFPARPGAGPVCAPRLLVACGDQRARYASAAEQQK
jgi:Transposase